MLRPGRRAADGDAAARGRRRWRRRTACRRSTAGQLELVAAGHEDAGRLVELARRTCGVVGLLAVLGPDAEHLGGAELAEERRRTPRRSRDRASDAVGITAIRASGPPARRTNSASGRCAAELVLGSADDEQRPGTVVAGTDGMTGQSPAVGMTGAAYRDARVDARGHPKPDARRHAARQGGALRRRGPPAPADRARRTATPPRRAPGWPRRGLVPTHAIVSSAARTAGDVGVVGRECRGLRGRADVRRRGLRRRPGHAPSTCCRTATPEATVLVFVGHNPTAAYLAHLLDDGDPDPDAFRAMTEGFPPGGARGARGPRRLGRPRRGFRQRDRLPRRPGLTPRSQLWLPGTHRDVRD